MLLIPLIVVLSGSLGNEEDRNAALGGLFLGIPPVAIGGGLAGALYQQQQKQRQAKAIASAQALQTQFYELLQTNDGQITVLQFASATGLTGGEAKAYLNERAQEFGADFIVSDSGEITYHFNG